MAKVTKKTEQVQKVVYEDKDVVTVTMSAEEARAVYSALWLMETETSENPDYVAIKDVQNAIGVVLEFPTTIFRSDSDHRLNTTTFVYIYPRN